MKCKKCNTRQFTIKINSDCGDCIHNPAWDEDEEEFTQKIKTIIEKDLVRDHALENGYCDLGDCFNEGCHLYRCINCGELSFLPIRRD